MGDCTRQVVRGGDRCWCLWFLCERLGDGMRNVSESCSRLLDLEDGKCKARSMGLPSFWKQPPSKPGDSAVFVQHVLIWYLLHLRLFHSTINPSHPRAGAVTDAATSPLRCLISHLPTMAYYEVATDNFPSSSRSFISKDGIPLGCSSTYIAAY